MLISSSPVTVLSISTVQMRKWTWQLVVCPKPHCHWHHKDLSKGPTYKKTQSCFHVRHCGPSSNWPTLRFRNQEAFWCLEESTTSTTKNWFASESYLWGFLRSLFTWNQKLCIWLNIAMKTKKQWVQVYFTLPGKIVWEAQSFLKVWYPTFAVFKKAACYKALTFRKRFQGVGSGYSHSLPNHLPQWHGVIEAGFPGICKPQSLWFTRTLLEFLVLSS